MSHRVTTGLQRLLNAEHPASAKLVGRRVGLLVNPTSIDDRFNHAADAALASGWNVVRLFGPEHGVRGEAQDMESVAGDSDPITGLPCVSLYGSSLESLSPAPSDLEGIDVLVIDLQDVGARYYTYAATAAYCASVCGKLGIDVIVCDRPNPLGGEVVEGNVVQDTFRSFVGAYPLATRHGMTLGELFGYLVDTSSLSCELTVVPMLGWTRDMFYDQTALPWVMPSPNMPTLDTALVYPGQCLLEGTNVSEGRGTTRPFEIFGAPWIDAPNLRASLEARDLSGCRFREVSFKPMFQKWAGEVCQGLQLHVTDRSIFRSLPTSIAILQEILEAHDEFDWRTDAYEFVEDRLAIDLLLGDSLLRHAIVDGSNLAEIGEAFDGSRTAFDAQRREALLYSGG